MVDVTVTNTKKCKRDLLTCECSDCYEKRDADIEIGGLYRLVEFTRTWRVQGSEAIATLAFATIPSWLTALNAVGKHDYGNSLIAGKDVFMVISSCYLVVQSPAMLVDGRAWLCMSSRGLVITLGKWLKRI